MCQVQKEEILFGQKKLENFFDVLPKTTLLKEKIDWKYNRLDLPEFITACELFVVKTER
jgi:hypothetical protein